jgi:hypothetical protein
MLLRILRTVHTEARDYPAGVNAEFPDPIARLLIARGQAEDPAAAPGPAAAAAAPPAPAPPAAPPVLAAKPPPKSPAIP